VTCSELTMLYRIAQMSVSCLVKCTPKCVRNLYYLENLQKNVRNWTLCVKSTAHNAVIELCKLTGRFKSEQSR
jgi:hypothetical protein